MTVNAVVASWSTHLEPTGLFRLDPRTMVVRMDLLDGPAKRLPVADLDQSSVFRKKLKVLPAANLPVFARESGSFAPTLGRRPTS